MARAMENAVLHHAGELQLVAGRPRSCAVSVHDAAV